MLNTISKVLAKKTPKQGYHMSYKTFSGTLGTLTCEHLYVDVPFNYKRIETLNHYYRTANRVLRAAITMITVVSGSIQVSQTRSRVPP